MKKVYTTPEIQMNTLSNTDIITVSGGLVTTKFTKGNKSEIADNSVNF